MAGLYIHIPFCVRKCDYCDFLSFSCHDEALRERYVRALLRQTEREERRRIDTVFFGGGTPSLLSGGQVARLMEGICAAFDVADGAEVTLEMNPGTADEGKLADYRAAGINRVSIGVQSLDDALLRGIGRIHDRAAALRTVELAMKRFDNVSADVMAGLPGQRASQHEATLRELCGLGLKHMSCYELIVEEGTPMAARLDELPDEDAMADMQAVTQSVLARHGYERYEVSNYAKPGYECRHNVNYWEMGEYAALGCGATGQLREDGALVRKTALGDAERYMRAAELGDDDVWETEERVGRADEMFEVMMMGLRLLRGVDEAAFERRFGAGVDETFGEAMARLAGKGLLERDGGRVRLSARGMELQNAVLVELMG